jgi:cytochrome b561
LERHLKISPEIYDNTTITLHWATAILVAIQFLIGTTTNFLPRSPLRVDIWSIHVLFGFTLAIMVVAGMVWRAIRGRRLPPPERGVRHLLAVTTHRLLDLLLLTMVAPGITNVFAHAFRCLTCGYFPRLGDEDFIGSVNAWHGIAANIIITVVLLHSAAALFHRYVIKAGVLRRMWSSPHASGDHRGPGRQ